MIVIAWVLRFLHNLRDSRDQRVSDNLSLEELRKAKLVLLGCVQKRDVGKKNYALNQSLSLPKTSSLQKLTPFIGEEDLWDISLWDYNTVFGIIRTCNKCHGLTS